MDEEFNSIDENWDLEVIPKDAILFCYVHKNSLDNKTKKPIERAFRNTPFENGKDLSSDWNKYSNPELLRKWIGTHRKKDNTFKNPLDYFIVQLNVFEIFDNIPSQTVKHNPIKNNPNIGDNRAHTLIIGEKDEEIRLKFVDICTWAISPY